MNDSMRNVKAWVEVEPDFTNLENDRSADQYERAINQFEIESNPRYTPRPAVKDGPVATYCNILHWDITKAMGVEVPHWVDEATGVEAPMGKGKELSANGTADWFSKHGLRFGWMMCDEFQARKRAMRGFPTVIIWKNPYGIGHVAIVHPRSTELVTNIAQAGSSNFSFGTLAKGFGGQKELRFYTHD